MGAIAALGVDVESYGAEREHLCFRATDAVDDVVDHFCARHAVRRAPCAQLLAHAASLQAAQPVVRLDVAIDRRVPLAIDGEERLWSIGLSDSAAHGFCVAHAIDDCAALVRSVRTERRERRAMAAGEVRIEVDGELFVRARGSGARFREGVLHAIAARGVADAPVVAIWSQTLDAASGYVAGSEITTAGLARAFRGEVGATLTLRFAGSVASNASHRAALDDALLLLPRLDLVVLEGHTPQLAGFVASVRRWHPAAVVLPWVLTSLEAARLRAEGDGAMTNSAVDASARGELYLPLAADAAVMHPGAAAARYSCDVAYVGVHRPEDAR